MGNVLFSILWFIMNIQPITRLKNLVISLNLALQWECPNTTDNTYSSVVSLHSMQIAIAAAELINLDIMVGDVSSTYLEAYTQEKVCFISGPEFGPLEGHLLVIVCALYRLRSSGARWHDCYADVMRMFLYTLMTSCSLARNLKNSLIL